MTESTVQALSPTSVAEFRALMAQFPTGVSIVTTMDGGLPRGMTCSSVCSVTIAPPTLLVCLRSASPTLAAIMRSETFAINLLHGRAQQAAELFASGAPDRFDLVRWELPELAAGPHLTDDAHATADCRVSRIERIGDHDVVFGETVNVTERDGHVPLLYGRRQFNTWPPAQ